MGTGLILVGVGLMGTGLIEGLQAAINLVSML